MNSIYGNLFCHSLISIISICRAFNFDFIVLLLIYAQPSFKHINSGGVTGYITRRIFNTKKNSVHAVPNGVQTRNLYRGSETPGQGRGSQLTPLKCGKSTHFQEVEWKSAYHVTR